MPHLIYVGPDPETFNGVPPLPEGWSPEDHDEEREAVAEAKVASGMYRVEGRPRRPGPKDVDPQERVEEAARAVEEKE